MLNIEIRVEKAKLISVTQKTNLLTATYFLLFKHNIDYSVYVFYT